MCGIVGFNHTQDADLLNRMTRLLEHRGPDSMGAFSCADISLGVRRLSIIDVKDGDQPIVNETDQVVVVFNGEIYNFPELRKELQARGHTFKTRTDTEVIVHLYEEEGPECVKRLNGMFAFALWDKSNKRLFLARDHLGVKPLYYTVNNGKYIAFASEIKALLELPFISRRVSPEALQLYLSLGSVPPPYSIFEGIRKLPPGCRLLADSNGIHTETYWQPPEDHTESIKPDYNEITQLLDNAVKRQLISDIPIGIHLSGGIDSSAIVALASRHVTTPLKTFTIGYLPPDQSYNELDKARRVAKLFGCEHHEFILPLQIKDLLVPLVRSFDEPFADSSCIPNYLLARETSRHVHVVLTGLGGDELFGGYPRYLGLQMANSLKRLPVWVRAALSATSGLLPNFGGSVNWPGRIKRFLRTSDLPLTEQYMNWMSLKSPEMRQALYIGPEDEAVRRYLNFGMSVLSPDLSPTRIALSDLTRSFEPDMLCLNDRITMVHSLEARVPFCDIPLVEYLTRIPLSEKIKGFTQKWILKDILKPFLPKDILTQTKMGFSISLAQWIRKGLNELLDEYLSEGQVRERGYFRPEVIRQMRHAHAVGQTDYADALWGLLILEVWHREYMDVPRAINETPGIMKADAPQGRVDIKTDHPKPKRILVVADEYFPEVSGGAARVPWEIAQGLAAKGENVFFLARHHGTESIKKEVNGVHLLGYRWCENDFIGSLWPARKLLLSHRPFDVVQIHAPFTGFICYLAGILPKTPSLYFFFSPWAEEFLIRERFKKQQGLLNPVWAFIRAQIERHLISRSKVIISLSEFMDKRLYAHHPNIKIPLLRMTGAADTQKFSPKHLPTEARGQLGWEKNRIHLLTVRNLEARMGLENLLDAMPRLLAKYPDIFLTLIGKGHLRPQLEEQVQSLGIHASVNFLGKVSDEVLALAYQAADVFILPTRELEGFGLVTVEALASGCPVVATPIGANPEILNKLDPTLLSTGTSPAEIAMAVEHFLDRKKQWPDLRVQYALFARQNFSWANAVADVEAATKQILDRKTD
jgi:asparagine synthase (glutamine-hydrolysing)